MNTNSSSRRDSGGEMELYDLSDNSPERLEDSSAEIINVQNSPKTFFLSAIGKIKEKIMPSRETNAKTQQEWHNKNKCIVGKMTAMEIALITIIPTFLIVAATICLFIGSMLESIPLILIGGIPLALMILAGISAECMH